MIILAIIGISLGLVVLGTMIFCILECPRKFQPPFEAKCKNMNSCAEGIIEQVCRACANRLAAA